MQACVDYLYEWYNWPNVFHATNARELLDAYPDYPVYATVIYLVCVFYLPGFLKKRNLKWKLKYPVALWNLFLSVCSTVGSYYTLSLLFGGVLHYLSFHQSLCERLPTPDDDKLLAYTRKMHQHEWSTEVKTYKKYHPDAPTAEDIFHHIWGQNYEGPKVFYIALFMYLKTPELLDTLFLILQGKPVSFLHWFHHIVTAIYAWHGGYVLNQSGFIFVANNYTVHSIMYFYYFLVMLGLREKIRPIAPFITMLQCLQMFIGLYVTVYMYLQYWCGPSKEGTLFYSACEVVFRNLFYLKHEAASLWSSGSLLPSSQLPTFQMEAHFYGCDVDRTNLRMASMMFGAYTVLFVRLFFELFIFKGYNANSLVVKRAVKETAETPSDMPLVSSSGKEGTKPAASVPGSAATEALEECGGISEASSGLSTPDPLRK